MYSRRAAGTPPRLRASEGPNHAVRPVLAMILVGKGQRLEPLTRERSKLSVPFGGRHRMVDFVLSTS
jgi:glucose-1-phosphate adenylyltransferase